MSIEKLNIINMNICGKERKGKGEGGCPECPNKDKRKSGIDELRSRKGECLKENLGYKKVFKLV